MPDPDRALVARHKALDAYCGTVASHIDLKPLEPWFLKGWDTRMAGISDRTGGTVSQTNARAAYEAGRRGATDYIIKRGG